MDISTTYLGLKLNSPVVVASSGLSETPEQIKRSEDNGAGAVILKSLFEEQIIMDVNSQRVNNMYENFSESEAYALYYTKKHNVEQYLKLIRNSKEQVDIPIIASINCVTNGKWTEFAKKIEDVGADAIEINVSVLPFDINRTSEDSEKVYFNILDKINALVKIPIALKLSHYSANIAHLVQQLSWRKQASAFVLFNRFYNPDIDINTKK